ncbi:MAG: amidophosphoribosyltransferase [Deltaproteobacteria bacterium]|jgi:methylamine---glutamate N-methyltransferase subunit A|nr:amidophosphoribosyltransferase [Deltaproteobacteria bacterium]
MCSIAGILFKHDKHPDLGMTTGKLLTEILDATSHRGPDSCGWGLYREVQEKQIRLRFFLSEGEKAKDDISTIKQLLLTYDATIISEKVEGESYALILHYEGNVKKLVSGLGQKVALVSVGNSLDIIKDVGLPYEVSKNYSITDFDGHHGLGHTRLATESGVHPDTSHPFWAPGFSDICAVHNGQITNYWIMRRRLTRQGMEFQTENDTELIAVYLAYKMSLGSTLEDALKTSLEDLDGTFSYLVATKDSIGYAKDKLAAKPMIKYEDEDMIAISSEEVGLNRIFPGKAIDTTEPAPLTYGIWSRVGPGNASLSA